MFRHAAPDRTTLFMIALPTIISANEQGDEQQIRALIAKMDSGQTLDQIGDCRVWLGERAVRKL